MFVVREARLDDAAAVVPFLVGILPGRNLKAYEFIFSFARSRIGLNGEDTERPLGAVLERPDGSVAGFLGVLASRMPHLTPGWVQHLTSWAVAADARTGGLRLLHHVIQARSGILANFSATPAVQAILPRFGFAPVDDAELTFSSVSLAGVHRRLTGRMAIDARALERAADSGQARILRDHLAMGCRVIAAERDGRSVAAVLLRLGSGLHATAQLVHLAPADDDAIASIWPALNGFSLLDMRCARIRVDARYGPAGAEPILRKPRQMLAANFSGHPRDLSRAYGEPLNGWATIRPQAAEN